MCLRDPTWFFPVCSPPDASVLRGWSAGWEHRQGGIPEQGVRRSRGSDPDSPWLPPPPPPHAPRVRGAQSGNLQPLYVSGTPQPVRAERRPLWRAGRGGVSQAYWSQPGGDSGTRGLLGWCGTGTCACRPQLAEMGGNTRIVCFLWCRPCERLPQVIA